MRYRNVTGSLRRHGSTLTMTSVCYWVLLSAAAISQECEVDLGPIQTVIPAGKWGLNAFPDGAITVLSSRSPVSFLMSVGYRTSVSPDLQGSSTVLLRGTSFEKATPIATVMRADNTNPKEQLAYLSAVIPLAAQEAMLGIIYQERSTGGQNAVGTHRFYATTGVALSKDKGATFERLGDIIVGRPEDPASRATAQGSGGGSVCIEPEGRYLYMYYTDFSRLNPANGEQRSVITCMARSLVEEEGRPGSWTKWFNGSFSEPGLGGKDTEIANCFGAAVVYVPEAKRFFMFGIRDGLCLFVSEDGIRWGKRIGLTDDEDVRVPGNEERPMASSPQLVIAQASPTHIKGYLFHSYSPNARVPSYLVKRKITLSLP